MAFTQSDLQSPNALAGILFPLVFVSAFLLIIIILVREFNKNRAIRLNKNNKGAPI
jgi:hypothetical protein